MDGFLEVADLVKTSIYQFFWFAIFTLAGAGIAGRLGMSEFESSWHQHHWQMIFPLVWTSAKIIFNSMILMATFWTPAALIIGYVGRRYHNRAFWRMWYRFRAMDLSGHRNPEVVNLWEAAQDSRFPTHRKMLAILGRAVTLNAIKARERVKDRLLRKTQNHRGMYYDPKRRYKPGR